MMKAIVTGKFEVERQAARAIDKLLRTCIPCDHVRTFFVNPRVSRTAPDRGEERANRAAEGKLHDRATNGPAVDRAIELEVGPANVADGVEVSAYMGSLARPTATMGDDDNQAATPPAEILVAVETSDHVSQGVVVSVLRQHGAHDIERARGPWHEGKWSQFNPVPLSSLIDIGEAKERQAALLRPKLNS